MTYRLILISACIVWALLVAAVPARAGELYGFAEFQQGWAFRSSNWTGDHPTFVTAGLHWEQTENVYVRAVLQHGSNIGRGSDGFWLADERQESIVNQVGVTVGLRFQIR